MFTGAAIRLVPRRAARTLGPRIFSPSLNTALIRSFVSTVGGPRGRSVHDTLHVLPPLSIFNLRSGFARSLSLLRSSRPGGRRAFCSDSKGNVAKDAKAAQEAAEEAGQKYALQTVTVVEGVKTGIQGTVFLGIAGLVTVCGYLIVRELMPDKMSPNSVFNEAFDAVKNNDRLTSRLGSPLKGYGRDNKGRREGRRNFIEHLKYTDNDGIAHTRIKFNVEGPRGRAVVYADTSKAMGSGTFYYLICEVPSKARGRKPYSFAVVDNRPKVPLSAKQSEVAERLVKSEVMLYGSLNDPLTIKQLQEFGESAKALKMNFVDCNANPRKCEMAGIHQLPTWMFKGKTAKSMPRPAVGYRKLEDLDTLAKQILD